jgi:chromate reductase, NAD(P)H dehydrogenase (quinone)
VDPMSAGSSCRSAPVRVLGLAGSLSRVSLSRALLRLAQSSAPEGMTIEIHDLAPLPFFNRDVEVGGGPEAVLDLKRRIHGADALLISTPEHNGGLPGVLVNAIDWVSRPPRHSPLKGKWVGVMAVAGGSGGTGAVVLPEGVTVAWAHTVADERGEIMDADLRGRVRELLDAVSVSVCRSALAEPAA